MTSQTKESSSDKGCRGFAIEMINFNVAIEKDWTDVFSKKIYQNAITINHHLPLDKKTAKLLFEMNVGDTIIMDLKPSPSTVNCFMADFLPNTFYEATNVELCTNR